MNFFSSLQEYGSAGVAHATSEYERRMMSVFSHVLEEVESLNRKYAPVSYMASNSHFVIETFKIVVLYIPLKQEVKR